MPGLKIGKTGVVPLKTFYFLKMVSFSKETVLNERAFQICFKSEHASMNNSTIENTNIFKNTTW